jgi:hypothetical protein
MERKVLAGAVPTQVVEIARPGRAVERKGELIGGAVETFPQTTPEILFASFQ